MRKVLAGLVALAVALPLAAPASAAGALALSARSHHHYRHHYRHYGNSRAALRMFGLVAGTIASAAAADEWRRGYDDGGYYDYPPPAYRYGPYYPY